MKKFYYFMMVCLFALGFIGGLGYTLYNEAYVPAVGVLGLTWLALPKVRECLIGLTL